MWLLHQTINKNRQVYDAKKLNILDDTFLVWLLVVLFLIFVLQVNYLISKSKVLLKLIVIMPTWVLWYLQISTYLAVKRISQFLLVC